MKPPYTSKYVRWCGRTGPRGPSYPIPFDSLPVISQLSWLRDCHPDRVVVGKTDGRNSGALRMQAAHVDPVEPLSGYVVGRGSGAEGSHKSAAAHRLVHNRALMLRAGDRQQVRDPVEISRIEIAGDDDGFFDRIDLAP